MITMDAMPTALRIRARERALTIGEALLCGVNTDQRGLAGNAGDALLFWGLTMWTRESRYEAAMHAALKRAATAEVAMTPGIFSGTSGLRAVADLACTIEPRYGRLVEQCDAFVESQLPSQPSQPSSYLTYDVVEGWAGQRLARAIRGPQPPDRLTVLLEWILAEPQRWTCPHPMDPQRVPVRDLGVAHGIAGVIAALVLTHEHLDSGARDLVAETSWFLASQAVQQCDYPAWPRSADGEQMELHQAAWCYGAPGITAVLHAAGRALGDEQLERLAFDSACAIARQTPGQWLVSQLGLCHGFMGNALCFASIAAACASDILPAAVERLVEATLDRLDADGGVCYTNHGRGLVAATDEMSGTAGVAIALLTLSGDVPADWMRAHALRPL